MSKHKELWVAKTEAEVTCSQGVLDLYSAEMHECHNMLDKLGIPKSGFEDQLSLSQRLRLAMTAMASLVETNRALTKAMAR